MVVVRGSDLSVTLWSAGRCYSPMLKVNLILWFVSEQVNTKKSTALVVGAVKQDSERFRNDGTEWCAYKYRPVLCLCVFVSTWVDTRVGQRIRFNPLPLSLSFFVTGKWQNLERIKETKVCIKKGFYDWPWNWTQTGMQQRTLGRWGTVKRILDQWTMIIVIYRTFGDRKLGGLRWKNKKWFFRDWIPRNWDYSIKRLSNLQSSRQDLWRTRSTAFVCLYICRYVCMHLFFL